MPVLRRRSAQGLQRVVQQSSQEGGHLPQHDGRSEPSLSLPGQATLRGRTGEVVLRGFVKCGHEFIVAHEEYVLVIGEDAPSAQPVSQPEDGSPQERPAKGEGRNMFLADQREPLGGFEPTFEALQELRLAGESLARLAFRLPPFRDDTSPTGGDGGGTLRGGGSRPAWRERT